MIFNLKPFDQVINCISDPKIKDIVTSHESFNRINNLYERGLKVYHLLRPSDIAPHLKRDTNLKPLLASVNVHLGLMPFEYTYYVLSKVGNKHNIQLNDELLSKLYKELVISHLGKAGKSILGMSDEDELLHFSVTTGILYPPFGFQIITSALNDPNIVDSLMSRSTPENEIDLINQMFALKGVLLTTVLFMLESILMLVVIGVGKDQIDNTFLRAFNLKRNVRVKERILKYYVSVYSNMLDQINSIAEKYEKATNNDENDNIVSLHEVDTSNDKYLKLLEELTGLTVEQMRQRAQQGDTSFVQQAIDTLIKNPNKVKDLDSDISFESILFGSSFSIDHLYPFKQLRHSISFLNTDRSIDSIVCANELVLDQLEYTGKLLKKSVESERTRKETVELIGGIFRIESRLFIAMKEGNFYDVLKAFVVQVEQQTVKH